MFTPTHCPNRSCPNFHNPKNNTWYAFFAFYNTKAFGKVPRFICRSCKRTFSSQTFSIDYYVKQPLDYRRIFCMLNSSAGIRNIARTLGIHHQSIINRIKRLSKNALIINDQLIALLPFNEDFVSDGFESFTLSQYFPDNYNILVGKDSKFLYYSDHVTIRRKGRMKESQKRKREILESKWRAERKGIEKSFMYLSEWLAEKSSKRNHRLILYTDEKKDYQRALYKSRVCSNLLKKGLWVHHRTNSKLLRDYRNPLFAVNYMDREFRKDMGNHARETVKFARDVNNAMDRLVLYSFEHNYIKDFKVEGYTGKVSTHYQRAGGDGDLEKRIVRDFFEKRYFKRGKSDFDKSSYKSISGGWETPLKVRGEYWGNGVRRRAKHFDVW